MSGSSELTGIGLAFLTTAGLLLLAVGGTLDEAALRSELIRLAFAANDLFTQVASSLPR